MANRGDVISVDKLWDVFDMEREKAWDGVDAPVGSPEWNIAAGKIDVINNICYAVHNMNAEPRSSADQAEKPVWEETTSVVHTDYADGSAETKTVKHASWCCPVCGWFVGEQVDVFGRKHNQMKKNFCDRCGQRIDWEGVEHDAGRSNFAISIHRCFTCARFFRCPQIL